MPVTDVRLRPMTDARFITYREEGEQEYAQQIAESGMMSAAAAKHKAAADFDRLLTSGLRTPGHHLWTAWDGPDEVGVLWIMVENGTAYVYDVQVSADRRRRGYGRAIMLAGEEAARSKGATSIGLNVFGQNAGAKSLYDQLGYQVTSTQMRKQL
jgi:ribosomal protein S18 acetylase RimI-like enzyme